MVMPGVGGSEIATQVAGTPPPHDPPPKQDDGPPGDVPTRGSSPASRATSARSHRTDPAGLITDLTKLREITHDDRVTSPTYRKGALPDFDFDDEPGLLPTQTQNDPQNVFSEPTDTVFYGEGFETTKTPGVDEPFAEFEKELDEFEEEFGVDEDDDDENVSSIVSDGEPYQAVDYDTDLEDAQEAESKFDSEWCYYMYVLVHALVFCCCDAFLTVHFDIHFMCVLKCC